MGKKLKFRKRGPIIWISHHYGPIATMGLDKNDPRYRNIQRRIKVRRIVAGVFAFLLITATSIGIVLSYLSLR